MTLRIIFKRDKLSASTMHFLDVSVQDWSVTGGLLEVLLASGGTKYFPLVNLESFSELQQEVEL